MPQSTSKTLSIEVEGLRRRIIALQEVMPDDSADSAVLYKEWKKEFSTVLVSLAIMTTLVITNLNPYRPRLTNSSMSARTQE
jgi:hypothetical protein